jgi:hypothetical protein
VFGVVLTMSAENTSTATSSASPAAGGSGSQPAQAKLHKKKKVQKSKFKPKPVVKPLTRSAPEAPAAADLPEREINRMIYFRDYHVILIVKLLLRRSFSFGSCCGELTSSPFRFPCS